MFAIAKLGASFLPYRPEFAMLQRIVSGFLLLFVWRTAKSHIPTNKLIPIVCTLATGSMAEVCGATSAAYRPGPGKYRHSQAFRD